MDTEAKAADIARQIATGCGSDFLPAFVVDLLDAALREAWDDGYSEAYEEVEPAEDIQAAPLGHVLDDQGNVRRVLESSGFVDGVTWGMKRGQTMLLLARGKP